MYYIRVLIEVDGPRLGETEHDKYCEGETVIVDEINKDFAIEEAESAVIHKNGLSKNYHPEYYKVSANNVIKIEVSNELYYIFREELQEFQYVILSFQL